MWLNVIAFSVNVYVHLDIIIVKVLILPYNFLCNEYYNIVIIIT